MPDHVLVVEDDDATRYAYERVLTIGGYQTKTYPNYFAAADDILQGVGKLLIIDLRLPPGTPQGVSVATVARRHRPGLPIIFITGHLEVAKMIPEHLGAVIAKPVSPDVLLAAVRQHLPPDEAPPARPDDFGASSG
jgi:DNA-binding NtrC family response regulator